MIAEISLSFPSWSQLLLAAAGVMTALFVVWKFLVMASKVIYLVNQLVPVLPTLIKIGEEFQPDHGTSLKDQVTRIETNQKMIMEKMKL